MTLAKSNIKDICILFSTSLSSFWGNLVDCPTPHDKSEKLLSLWMKEYDAPRDDLQELNPITDYWRIIVPRLVSSTYIIWESLGKCLEFFCLPTRT